MTNLASCIIVGCAALLAATPARAQDVPALLKKHGCTLCHRLDAKSAGPAFKQIAEEYRDRPDAETLLAKSIKKGSIEAWGPVRMLPFPKVPDADVTAIVRWILALK